MNEIERTPEILEEVNPWIDIWFSPQKTINWIVNNYSSELTIIILIYFGGVYFGIGQSELKNYGDKISVGNIFINTILLSGLGGLLTYNIWIWAIDFCAHWFGGKGNFRKTQSAFAWAMLPMVAGIILTLIGYVLFEEELFTSETPKINESDFLTISFWMYGIIEFVLGAWHICLLVLTVSQVQQFSIFKSIASIVTGLAILILPLFGLIFLIKIM